MSILQVENLNKAFGGLKVTNDVSLSLSVGERLALIGPPARQPWLIRWPDSCTQIKAPFP